MFPEIAPPNSNRVPDGTLSLTAQAQSAITEQEAQSIAADAYIYFYPLVLMDITRKQSTNIEPGRELPEEFRARW